MKATVCPESTVGGVGAAGAQRGHRLPGARLRAQLEIGRVLRRVGEKPVDLDRLVELVAGSVVVAGLGQLLRPRRQSVRELGPRLELIG